MEIINKTLGGAHLLERTFHVVKKNAGFLGLGVLIQAMVEGKPIDNIVVYGDTLHAIKRHVDAQVSGDPIKIVTTNKALPKRLQYPTDASIK